MAFIIALGAVMISQNSSDTLIENDYYEKGQAYNKDYDAKQAALDDEVIPNIAINEFGVTITFPIPVEYKLLCRRPSDYHQDRTIEGFTDEDRNIRIEKGELQPGPWLLRIQYTAKGKHYLFEIEIIMP